MVSLTSSSKNLTLRLVYPCHICKNTNSGYGKASTMLKHVRDVHGIDLPSRRIGIRRPANSVFNYQTDTQQGDEYETHLACPSCWYHTENIHNLKTHIEEKHDPIAVETKPYTYDSYNTRYNTDTINTVFEQINDISNMFKKVLRM